MAKQSIEIWREEDGFWHVRVLNGDILVERDASTDQNWVAARASKYRFPLPDHTVSYYGESRPGEPFVGSAPSDRVGRFVWAEPAPV